MKRLGEFKETGLEISSWWHGDFSNFRISFSFGKTLVLKSDHFHGLIFEDAAHSGNLLYAWQEDDLWTCSKKEGQFTARSLEVVLAKTIL